MLAVHTCAACQRYVILPDLGQFCTPAACKAPNSTAVTRLAGPQAPSQPNPPPNPTPVSCVDDDVTDGYGARLGRRGSCKGSGSVVVTITDTVRWSLRGGWGEGSAGCCIRMKGPGYSPL